MMREVADGVFLLDAAFPDIINAYLVRIPGGEMLVDAGTRWATGSIVRQLRKRRLVLVGLTHVHPDHQGAAARVCTLHNVPLACHSDDVPAMEGTGPMVPDTTTVRVSRALFAGPPHPVAVRWHGGERLGEWEMIHAPGHTPGHVMFWRERDGVAIVGDVVRNLSLRRGLGTLSETPWYFSADWRENRRSMRRLLELRPTLLLSGHGPPSRDVTRLAAMVARTS